MTITQIKVDGVAVSDLTTPVKVKLKGSGKHTIQYVSDSDTIKSEAFKNCDIESLKISYGIKHINRGTFKDSKLETLTFESEEPPTIEEGTLTEDIDIVVKAEYLDKWTDFNPDTVKDNVFHSEIEVGDILYEKTNGDLYTHKYDESISDKALGTFDWSDRSRSKVYVATPGGKEIDMVTTANPRFSTRPFIVI